MIENASLTFTLNNFGTIISESSALNTSQTHVFNVEIGPVQEAICTSTEISDEQLSLSSHLAADSTGSIVLQNISDCIENVQRISFSVFRTDALFLTPETVNGNYQVGSIIISARAHETQTCEGSKLVINLQPVGKVRVNLYGIIISVMATAFCRLVKT